MGSLFSSASFPPTATLRGTHAESPANRRRGQRMWELSFCGTGVGRPGMPGSICSLLCTGARALEVPCQFGNCVADWDRGKAQAPGRYRSPCPLPTAAFATYVCRFASAPSVTIAAEARN